MVAADPDRFEVRLGGRFGAGDADFDLPQFGPGFFERFETYGDAVPGADLLLAKFTPAVQVGYGPLQLLGGLVRGGGQFLGLFRLAIGAATNGGRLPPQGVGDLRLLPAFEFPVAGGTLLLGATVDGLPGLVHVAGLALVGVGLSPVVRRELPQLLLLLAQLPLRPLQILAAGEVFEVLSELGDLPPRRLVLLFGFVDPLRSQPVRGVILRRLS